MLLSTVGVQQQRSVELPAVGAPKKNWGDHVGDSLKKVGDDLKGVACFAVCAAPREKQLKASGRAVTAG